jgi:hypothetical protein
VSVIGWCGDASVLTFQRPTRRAKSPCVGNIHYRHLPGYRLEVKTAGSGASSRAELRSSALGVREFLILLGWEAKETGHSEVQRMLGGEEFGRVGAALFASREAQARYRCRAQQSGIAAGSIQEPRRRRRLRFGCQSSESLKSRHKKGDRPKRGMIMIAGSLGFGRL